MPTDQLFPNSDSAPQFGRRGALPVQHTPQESADSALIGVPCSGVDASVFAIPPRAVGFNDAAIFQCHPLDLTYDGVTGSVTSVLINVPVRGFESGAFKRVLQSDGSELASLTAAYFVW